MKKRMMADGGEEGVRCYAIVEGDYMGMRDSSGIYEDIYTDELVGRVWDDMNCAAISTFP